MPLIETKPLWIVNAIFQESCIQIYLTGKGPYIYNKNNQKQDEYHSVKVIRNPCFKEEIFPSFSWTTHLPYNKWEHFLLTNKNIWCGRKSKGEEEEKKVQYDENYIIY